MQKLMFYSKQHQLIVLFMMSHVNYELKMNHMNLTKNKDWKLFFLDYGLTSGSDF